MRPSIILALATSAVFAGGIAPAAAQVPQTGFTTTGPNRAPATGFSPAPVPSIPPPSQDSGAPSFVPEKVARPMGGGVGIGSATSATPFSSGPVGTTLPDGQPPSAHDQLPDGIAGPAAGTSR